LLRRNSKI